MKCPTCKKDYEEGVKSAYRLGFLNGREDQDRPLNKAINNIQAAFGHLFDEVRRCDKEDPLPHDPNYVHITIKKSILLKHILIMGKHDKNLAQYYHLKLNEHKKRVNCANNHIVDALKLSKSK